MSENRTKRAAPRTAFKPGHSGNPGGRPKSTLGKTLAKVLAEKHKEKPHSNELELVREIVRDAIAGDKDMRLLIWDRMEGKTPQAVDFGSGGQAVKFTLSLGDGGDA